MARKAKPKAPARRNKGAEEEMSAPSKPRKSRSIRRNRKPGHR